MAYYLTVTIGFVLFIATFGFIFAYYLSLGLKSSDSTKIDSIK